MRDLSCDDFNYSAMVIGKAVRFTHVERQYAYETISFGKHST